MERQSAIASVIQEQGRQRFSLVRAMTVWGRRRLRLKRAVVVEVPIVIVRKRHHNHVTLSPVTLTLGIREAGDHAVLLRHGCQEAGQLVQTLLVQAERKHAQ